MFIGKINSYFASKHFGGENDKKSVHFNSIRYFLVKNGRLVYNVGEVNIEYPTVVTDGMPHKVNLLCR